MHTDSESSRSEPLSQEIERLLRTASSVAVVGLSATPGRPSHYVSRYLIDHGYRVIPVNPGLSEVLGLRCYPSVAAIPDDVAVDIVDVFRRSEAVPAIVEEAIARRARAVWMQLGVRHEAAARRAREAGLLVVMDDCIKIRHGLLLGS